MLGESVYMESACPPHLCTVQHSGHTQPRCLQHTTAARQARLHLSCPFNGGLVVCVCPSLFLPLALVDLVHVAVPLCVDKQRSEEVCGCVDGGSGVSPAVGVVASLAVVHGRGVGMGGGRAVDVQEEVDGVAAVGSADAAAPAAALQSAEEEQTEADGRYLPFPPPLHSKGSTAGRVQERAVAGRWTPPSAAAPPATKRAAHYSRTERTERRKCGWER